MSVIRMSLIAAVLAGSLAGGVAAAQMPSAPTCARRRAGRRTSKWTQTQCNAARSKWSKKQVRWNACNKKATDQKLTGRKSWSFVASCMTG